MTSSRLFASFIFVLALALTTSCEKESFAPAPTSNLVEYADLAEAEHMPKEKTHTEEAAFTFEVHKSYCTQDGVHLSIFIDRSENYRFKWVIDGKQGGYNSYVPGCVCGKTATVFITRLSDGASLRRDIDLPNCSVEAESIVQSEDY